MHAITLTGPAGGFRQTTHPRDETRRLHTALDLPLPPRILHLDTERRNPLTSHNTPAW